MYTHDIDHSLFMINTIRPDRKKTDHLLFFLLPTSAKRSSLFILPEYLSIIDVDTQGPPLTHSLKLANLKISLICSDDQGWHKKEQHCAAASSS